MDHEKSWTKVLKTEFRSDLCGCFGFGCRHVFFFRLVCICVAESCGVLGFTQHVLGASLPVASHAESW